MAAQLSAPTLKPRRAIVMVRMRSGAPTRGIDRVIDLLDQRFLVGTQSLRFVRWRKIRA
jgi:hypothetical protein